MKQLNVNELRVRKTALRLLCYPYYPDFNTLDSVKPLQRYRNICFILYRRSRAERLKNQIEITHHKQIR